MISIFTIEQLLKKFGTIIYMGNRIADLQLMQDELRELNQSYYLFTRLSNSFIFVEARNSKKEINKN